MLKEDDKLINRREIIFNSLSAQSSNRKTNEKLFYLKFIGIYHVSRGKTVQTGNKKSNAGS